jgi:hypothetical protein
MTAILPSAERRQATDRRSRSPGGGQRARHVERPHAVGAYVAEGHGRPGRLHSLLATERAK